MTAYEEDFDRPGPSRSARTKRERDDSVQPAHPAEHRTRYFRARSRELSYLDPLVPARASSRPRMSHAQGSEEAIRRQNEDGSKVKYIGALRCPISAHGTLWCSIQNHLWPHNHKILRACFALSPAVPHTFARWHLPQQASQRELARTQSTASATSRRSRSRSPTSPSSTKPRAARSCQACWAAPRRGPACLLTAATSYIRATSSSPGARASLGVRGCSCTRPRSSRGRGTCRLSSWRYIWRSTGMPESIG